MSRISKGDSYKHLPRKEKAVLEVIVAIAAGGTGLATVALAVITGYYAYENRQMRIDAQRPKIAIYLHRFVNIESGRLRTVRMPRESFLDESPAKKTLKTYLCVENIGPGIAYDVRFEKVPKFKPDLLIESAPIFSKGVNHLKPGGLKGIRIELYTEEHETQIKTPFKINVTYKDSRKKKYGEPFCIDFNETQGVLDAVPEN